MRIRAGPDGCPGRGGTPICPRHYLRGGIDEFHLQTEQPVPAVKGGAAGRWEPTSVMRKRAGRGASPRPTTRGAALAAVAFFCAACTQPDAEATAEDDHAHAGGGTVTHWTGALELFVEYPPHVRDIPSDPWAIHLTWLEGWQPVREGTLTLLLRGPGGAREEIVMAEPDRSGIYTATPTLTATGTWRADLTLAARGRHAIPVGQLQVFENEDALPHDVEQPPPGLITLLKEHQWSMPFAVALAEERLIPRTIPAAGEIAAPGGGLAHVSTLVAGIIVARRPALNPGERVSAGQTLALIAPASLDDSYSRLLADVAAAEREAARTEYLFEAGAIARRRFEHAQHELEVAHAALEALGGVRPAGGADSTDVHLYHLRSPIAGVVSERHVAPGQHVEAGTHAFTVVNPETLWFVARVPARDAGEAGNVSGAWFTVEGAPGVHRAGRLVSVGSVIDPESRTLPVRFAVANPEGTLKVGMLANGHLLVGERVGGVAVPAAAVQEEDGQAVVYVKVGGEAFQRRVVEPGPTDGAWVLVGGEIASGEQVVTTGAYQVRLASLGDAEISDHGHPH